MADEKPREPHFILILNTMPTKIKLFLIAWIVSLASSAALGGDNGPVDTIRTFYQRYLDLADRYGAGAPRLTFSTIQLSAVRSFPSRATLPEKSVKQSSNPWMTAMRVLTG